MTAEHCRIVKYDDYYDYIERSFDGEEVSPLKVIYVVSNFFGLKCFKLV